MWQSMDERAQLYLYTGWLYKLSSFRTVTSATDPYYTEFTV